jgi:hypothetical protein
MSNLGVIDYDVAESAAAKDILCIGSHIGSGNDCAAGGRLRRTFRKRDGVALIVSSVVGVGIFTTPALVADLVPDPIAMLSLWIMGGALALAGAASYARLAKLWPKGGR